MSIRVEFFGVCRQRAGVASIDVDADDLRTALLEIGSQLPKFADVCIENGRLKPGYIANINGRSFTSDPATPLVSGDAILLLSADAGG